MYPREANAQIIAMVKAGLVKLDTFDYKEFSLDEANKAVEYAAEQGGPFRMSIIRPNGK